MRGLIPPGWRVLALRDYRRLWLAHAGSVVGGEFHAIAITWLVFDTLGGGPQALAVLGIANVIPALALGVISGTIVDRADRRRVMVASDLASAGLVAVLAVMVATGTAEIPAVVTIGVALTLAGLFFSPARNAVLPAYVPDEDLVAANALFTSTWQAARLIVPAVGGILFVAIGPVGLLAIDAASFVWSALLIWRLDPRPALPPATPRRPLLQEAADGVRFIAGHRPSRWCVLTGAGNQLFATGPFRTMVPAWVAIALGGGAPEYGTIISALAAGLLVGSLFVSAMRVRLPLMRAIAVGVFIDGVAWVAFAVAPTLVVACAAMVALGISNAVLNTAFSALLQTAVPADMRGRTFATFSTTMNLTTPISLGLTGAFAAAGPVPIIAISGLGLMAVGAVSFATAPRGLGQNPPEAARTA